MPTDAKAEVTAILAGLSGETPKTKVSPEQLLPLVYDPLRRLAASYFRRERPDHTLQPTALVHEAYERLADQTQVDWRGKSHFFAVCAQVMRRVLVDHARRRGRLRRGGNEKRVTFGEFPAAVSDLGLEDLLAVDEALERLAALDERGARVVELRCFGGLSAAEIGRFLGVSERTVRNDWAHGRAWLAHQLSEAGGA